MAQQTDILPHQTDMQTTLRTDPEWARSRQTREEKEQLLIDILGQQPIFDPLSLRELQKLERIVHRRRFEPGEVIIQAWIPRTGLFIILSGSVHVTRTTLEGEQIVIGELGAGELLGEFAILDDSPRSTSIVAAERCEAIGFFRSDLMDLIQTDPSLGFKILHRLSQTMAARLSEVLQSLRQLRSGLRAAREA